MIPPKIENIKIKIKTSNLKPIKQPKRKRAVKQKEPPPVIVREPVIEKVPPIVVKKPIATQNGNRVTRRSSRRNHQTTSASVVVEVTPPPLPPVIEEEVPKSTSPLPGTENYDLYRVLASPEPSEEKEFDSQSSILGSISSKETRFVTTAGPEDSRVIHSRGSSDLATSDIETSQSSSVVAAPPSERQANIFSESETELKEVLPEPPVEAAEPPQQTTVAPGGKRSTRRGGATLAAVNTKMKSPPPTIETSLVPVVVGKTSGRVTRNNNNITTSSTRVIEVSFLLLLIFIDSFYFKIVSQLLKFVFLNMYYIMS